MKPMKRNTRVREAASPPTTIRSGEIWAAKPSALRTHNCAGWGRQTSTPSKIFGAAIEPITESDDEIRLMLEEAEIPPLLPALAYVTGDLSLLRDDLRPNALMLALPQGGLDDAQLAAARELALEALVRFRDNGS